MRVLLDTHIALWIVNGESKLSTEARDLVSGADEVFVSAASVWEVAIKHAHNRMGVSRIGISGAEALAEFEKAGMQLLPITPVHAAYVDQLPRLHADPFDRILVAQALTEPLILLTHDRQVGAYSDTIIVV